MIARSSSQTQPIEDYRRYFPHLGNEGVDAAYVDIKITAHGRLLDVVESQRLFGAEYLGVFDNDELVAVLNTWEAVEEVPYRHIGKTIVEPSYQGNRIIRQLIEWWVQTHNQCLASDENQTHDGARVWESMIIKESRLSFSLWWPDGREEKVTVQENHITPDPWAEQHTRLLARP